MYAGQPGPPGPPGACWPPWPCTQRVLTWPPGATRAAGPACFDLAARGHQGHQGHLGHLGPRAAWATWGRPGHVLNVFWPGRPGPPGPARSGHKKTPSAKTARGGQGWGGLGRYFKMPMTLRMNSTPAGQGLRGLVKLLDVWPGARGQTAAGVHQELSGRSVVVQARATTGKKKTPKPQNAGMGVGQVVKRSKAFDRFLRLPRRAALLSGSTQ